MNELRIVMKLILIKSGFRSRRIVSIFAMKWQLLNKRPIVFKEENFGLFKLYSLYYIVCKEKLGLGVGNLKNSKDGR